MALIFLSDSEIQNKNKSPQMSGTGSSRVAEI